MVGRDGIEPPTPGFSERVSSRSMSWRKWWKYFTSHADRARRHKALKWTTVELGPANQNETAVADGWKAQTS